MKYRFVKEVANLVDNKKLLDKAILLMKRVTSQGKLTERDNIDMLMLIEQHNHLNKENAQ